MAEDRLRKDYDVVENLDDLIKAREERESAFADDVDAMDDIPVSRVPLDPVEELTRPHRHGPSEEERLGIDVELMGTPDESEIEFDWQDSVEEMLPVDPHPDEGMGADEFIESAAHVEAADLTGPLPSVDVSPEADTAATEAEREEYDIDGGEPPCPPIMPVQLESAMDTDSDEEDFRIIDKFEGQVDRKTALEEFEEIREATEEESGR